MKKYISLKDLAGTLTGRGFIVGNGPSLADTDVAKLKEEHVFGSNRVYLGYEDWGFSFPYWCIEDTRVCRDTANEWNYIDAKIKFVPFDLKDQIRNWDNICLVNFVRRGWKNIGGKPVFWPDFSLDPARVYFGFTVTYMMIQIAFIMGCNPLYLIGVDHYYQRLDDIQETGQPAKLISSGADPDHFHPDYFGKGKKYHKPRLDLSINAYRVAELTCIEERLKIYNASARTRLDVFEEINFESLF